MSIKFPFNIKTIGYQYTVSEWCRHHISHIFYQVCTRRVLGLQSYQTRTESIIGSHDDSQFMRNNKRPILVWRNISQFNYCSAGSTVRTCISIIGKQIRIIEIVNSKTQWFYLIIIKVCKWLVLKQWVDEFCRVIFIRS